MKRTETFWPGNNEEAFYSGTTTKGDIYRLIIGDACRGVSNRAKGVPSPRATCLPAPARKNEHGAGGIGALSCGLVN
jgi:hypothetical protein